MENKKELPEEVHLVLDHLGLAPEQVLFKNRNKARANFRVSRARHLIKYLLYVDSRLSTPKIFRLLGEKSTGFDHASTLYSVRIVNEQKYIFWQDVTELREKLLKKQQA